MKSKTYRIIEHALLTRPELRSTKRIKSVIWYVWMSLGYADNRYIAAKKFSRAPSPESITRVLRKVKEDHNWKDADAIQQENKYREEYARQ